MIFNVAVREAYRKQNIAKMLLEHIIENAKNNGYPSISLTCLETTYPAQIFKIIDPDKTKINFNSDWLNAMTFAKVLELCGKTTVARILERDDFSTRFKNRTPNGLHEFLYPLMQAYDSVAIKADIEIGGTDQTFNINMGRRMMQSYGLESQLTLFMLLLEGTDGAQKMGKSLNNYVEIHEPPAVIYEKLMSIPDSCIIKSFDLCTDLPPDEVSEIQLSIERVRILVM